MTRHAACDFAGKEMTVAASAEFGVSASAADAKNEVDEMIFAAIRNYIVYDYELVGDGEFLMTGKISIVDRR